MPTTITIEGGLLPSDMLETIAEGDVRGQRPVDFGLSWDARLVDSLRERHSEC